MNRSESINELATALSKAQGVMMGALKDSANPFFKSKYADLASVWDACRKPLSENGLAVIQTTENDEGQTYLSTVLVHSSGQWISGRLPIKPVKDDPQGLGSAITYVRRYGLSAIVGIAPEDDDGNAASGKKATVEQQIGVKVNVPHDDNTSEFGMAGEYVLPITINKGKRLSQLHPDRIASARSVAEKNGMNDVIEAIDRYTKANADPLGFDAKPKEEAHG